MVRSKIRKTKLTSDAPETIADTRSVLLMLTPLLTTIRVGVRQNPTIEIAINVELSEDKKPIRHERPRDYTGTGTPTNLQKLGPETTQIVKVGKQKTKVKSKISTSSTNESPTVPPQCESPEKQQKVVVGVLLVPLHKC